MKKTGGYITVYLALVLGLLLVLIITVIDGARRQTIRFETECVMDAGLNSIFAEYNREMAKQYGLLFIDDSYGANIGSVENTKKHLLSYMNMNFRTSYNSLFIKTKNLTDISADNAQLWNVSYASDYDGEVLRYQILRYLKDCSGISIANKDNSMILDLDELQNEYSNYQNMKRETYAGISGYEEEINNERLKSGEEEIHISNPADSVNDISNESVLYYAISDFSEISAKSVNVHDYISHRKYGNGYGLYQGQKLSDGLMDNVLFSNYIFDKCGYYSHKKDNSNLDYQIEYILKGKACDVENMEAVAESIFAIRYTVNISYLTLCKEKQAEAEALAIASAAILQSPELIELIKWSILFAWAYAESAKDLRILYDGHPLAAVKTDQEWNTPLEHLVTFKSHLSEYRVPQSGMNYKDFLMAFLALESEKQKTLYLMDIMEMDIRMTHGNEHFKVDNLIYQLNATVNVSSGYGYGYEITRQFSYN